MLANSSVFSSETWHEVLSWLSDKAQTSLSFSSVEQALVEAGQHPLMRTQPLETLRYLAGFQGIDLSARHLPLKEALKYLQRETPLLLMGHSDNGEPLLIALSGFRWFHFEVTLFSQQGAISRWLPWRKLKTYLGSLPDDSIFCLLLSGGSVTSEPVHLSPRQHLLRLMRTEKTDIGIIIIYSIVTGLFSLVIPVTIQALVNNVAFGALMQPIVILTGLVFGSLCFLALLRTLRLNLVEIIQQRLFIRVAADLSERVLQVQLPFFSARHHGPEFLNRFFDVLTLQKASALLLTDGLAILLQTLTGMLLLAIYHPLLLGFALALLVAILVILFILGIGGEYTAIKESKMKYAVAAWLEEISSHQTPFRSHAGHRYARQRTDQMLRDYLKARKSHFQVIQRQYVGTYLLQAVASAALLGLGGWLVIERQLSIGQLVAAELVVANLLDGFAKFGKHLETYYDLLAALDKLAHLFELPIEKRRPGLLLPTSKGLHVAFHQVSFQSSEGQSLLNQLSVDIQPGSNMAILGPQSWSHYVFADLLYGGREPTQGWITMDGRDLRELQTTDLRSQVMLVRGLDILTGSVEENLRLGQLKPGAADVRAVLEAVGLWERICALPEGLATPLSLSGFPLSPEESHRLMIARALLMRPRLLILQGTLDLVDWKLHGPLAHFLLSEHPAMTLIVLTNRAELLQGFQQTCALNAAGELELIPRSADHA
jgi:putative ABC transport system ATP-binding protein